MSNVIKQYLKDIKNIPLLTQEDEIRLAKRVRRGDTEARKMMIKSNLRLVINIAKRYSYLGVPISDLIEEGNIGLMKAVSKYNPGKGYRFSTYAAWWIKQYILRAIANQGKMIRIPVYMVEMISRYKRVSERLTQKLRRKPTSKEIGRSMKMPIKKVREISNLSARPASLDAPIGDEGTAEFIDLIEDVTSESAHDELADFLRHEKVQDLLARMKDRERRIIEIRYGLKDGVSRTLSETAKKFGITRERVRQIEAIVLKRLRQYLLAQEEKYK